MDVGMFMKWVPFDSLHVDRAIALYTKLGTREDVLHFDIPVEGTVVQYIDQ